ncbi:nucleotidyltransferase domain-containing protein [Streptomyces milbemycinicus]|uniref:nucleotidyltransferase domain-containing protein n=1 Tax=Streptomyces milbemycinicus TaxID=476552 RepID=UPI0033C8952A
MTIGIIGIEDMAARLVQEVPGVVGVMLGGSRARGEHAPDSDWDLGVYYRGPLDVERLRGLAAEVVGGPVEVAGPGGWGPWVNGGAWLDVDGQAVDWILRDVDRVRTVWEDCRAGRYEVGTQIGHPLGFWSPCYVGEVALGRVLADPGGELGELRREVARCPERYPEPLRDALTAGPVWEAGFLVANAAKSARRGDVLHVSLCLARVVGLLVQALFAHHRRWCLNEKGALAAVAGMPDTPAGFVGRAGSLLGELGGGAGELTARVAGAGALVDEVRAVVGG